MRQRCLLNTGGYMLFPVAGIEISPIIPVASAFIISLFCSMGGISGAFLLLPYQTSVLGYVNPGVSGTNLIFNVLACPAGVWRFAREGRLLWPLALLISAGSVPGAFMGAYARIAFFAKPERFRLFAALLLLYLAFRLIPAKKLKKAQGTGGLKCKTVSFTMRELVYKFGDATRKSSVLGITALSFLTGVGGGIYGIGGGAVMAPLLVSFFGIPLHAVGGACLFATFLTSAAGAGFFFLLSIWMHSACASPDWLLGLLFGLGGALGMYVGAATQKYVSPYWLRWILFIPIFSIAMIYIAQTF